MNIFWPDVSTTERARKAARLGAFALGVVAISATINIVDISLTGQDGPGRLYSINFVDDDERYGMMAIYGLIAILAAWFCRRLWLRYSVAAAWVGLAWQIVHSLNWVGIISEVGIKAVAAKGYALVLPILLVWFAVHGVRGALANKRLAAGPALIQSATAEPGGQGTLMKWFVVTLTALGVFVALVEVLYRTLP